jgi:hypothetical protein
LARKLLSPGRTNMWHAGLSQKRGDNRYEAAVMMGGKHGTQGILSARKALSLWRYNGGMRERERDKA